MLANLDSIIEKYIELAKSAKTPEYISLQKRVGQIIARFQMMIAMDNNIQKQITEYKIMLSETAEELNEIEKQLDPIQSE